MLRRIHPQMREGQAADNYEKEGGQNAPGAPFIKGEKGEFPLFLLTHNDGGDEIAGDNEKHVHANKAAGKAIQPSMEQHNR